MKNNLRWIFLGFLVVLVLGTIFWPQRWEAALVGGPQNSGLVGVLLYGLFGVAAILLYFLPVIIASRTDHPHTSGIGLLNTFLGWTLLGWVVALVWAVTASRGLTPAAGSASPALGRCPDCGGLLSIHAEACPHCGRPRHISVKTEALP